MVAYRMPLGMSVIWKPSHCPKCKTQILARDNVPVLGWLWLKGKCRACSEPISPRYAIVEAVMGLTFFVLCYAEVFSGGANLPTGPLTEGRGALENVIEPNWTVLGVYGYHCLVMCILMCLVLIDQDTESICPQLTGAKSRMDWPLIFALSVAIFLDYFWKPLRDLWLLQPTSWITYLFLLIFIFCFVLLAAFKPAKVQLVNLWFSVMVSYTLLGTSSMATIPMLTACVALLLLFIQPLAWMLNKRVLVTSCFVASVMQVVFWKQLESALKLTF